jgi:hypothetical protein
MPLPVLIDTLAEELDGLPDETRVYVHRETGELITVPNHDIGVFEDGLEDEEELEWDCAEEELPKLREIASRTGAWIALPDKFEIHEWSIMERFAEEADEPMASKLDRAIHGRGAFRLFRSVLDDYGATEAWYKFKHEQLVELVASTLDDEKVPYRRGYPR